MFKERKSDLSGPSVKRVKPSSQPMKIATTLARQDIASSVLPSDHPSLIVGRKSLVSDIYSSLKTERVLILSAPPRSGKSTLVNLLKKHIVQLEPKTQVVSLNGWDAHEESHTETLNRLKANIGLQTRDSRTIPTFSKSNRDLTLAEWVAIKAAYRRVDEILGTKKGDFVLVIDNVHKMYESGFQWCQFLEAALKSKTGLRVVLAGRPESPLSQCSTTRARFPSFSVTQIIPLAVDDSPGEGLARRLKLKLTPEESTEIVRHRLRLGKASFADDLVRRLVSFAGGHVGSLVSLTAAVMDDEVRNYLARRFECYVYPLMKYKPETSGNLVLRGHSRVMRLH